MSNQDELHQVIGSLIPAVFFVSRLHVAPGLIWDLISK
jgi:hypothetical protein